MVRTLLFLLSAIVGTTSGGSILFIMDIGSKSHFLAWKPLLLELAKRGHQMTMVAPAFDKELDSMKNVDFIEIKCGLSVESSDIFEGKFWKAPFPPMQIESNIQVRKSFDLPIDLHRSVRLSIFTAHLGNICRRTVRATMVSNCTRK